jgi:hypothetical protein
MIIGNRTATPRAVLFHGKYLTIEPMGMVSLEDTADNREELERLKKTELFQAMLDAGVLVLNEQVNPGSAPVEVQGPQPPAELLADPVNPRVSKGKPKKTNETMKV